MISFPLDDGSYENMHANALEDGSFVLENSPFYAFDVSYKDVVNADVLTGKLYLILLKKEEAIRHIGLN